MSNNIRIEVGDELLEKLLEKNPAVTVSIRDSMIERTSQKIIKSALNGSDPARLVDAGVKKALKEAIETAGLKAKQVGRNWNTRTEYELAPVVREMMLPLIRSAIEKVIQDEITVCLSGEFVKAEVARYVKRDIKEHAHRQVMNAARECVPEIVNSTLASKLGLK